MNDYEKIIVHTVINGDTKNAKQYYVGEALHGTSLLNFLNEHKDETMPSLEGYTTDGKWYNLDHPGQEITGQTTVNGWTNLYVNFVAEGTDPGTTPAAMKTLITPAAVTTATMAATTTAAAPAAEAL